MRSLQLMTRHIKKSFPGGPGGPGGPNEIGNGEGPPASLMYAMQMMSNGCGPMTDELEAAFSEVVDSKILESNEMSKYVDPSQAANG